MQHIVHLQVGMLRQVRVGNLIVGVKEIVVEVFRWYRGARAPNSGFLCPTTGALRHRRFVRLLLLALGDHDKT